MIQPRDQRHHVLDVDCKLEISQCLIYIASYSLQITLTYIISFAFSELHDMNRRSVNNPHLENKGCEGQRSLGSRFNFHSKKATGLESDAQPSNSAFSPALCVPTLSGCHTFPQIPRGGSFLLSQALSLGTHQSTAQLNAELQVHSKVYFHCCFTYSTESVMIEDPFGDSRNC